MEAVARPIQAQHLCFGLRLFTIPTLFHYFVPLCVWLSTVAIFLLAALLKLVFRASGLFSASLFLPHSFLAHCRDLRRLDSANQLWVVHRTKKTITGKKNRERSSRDPLPLLSLLLATSSNKRNCVSPRQIVKILSFYFGVYILAVAILSFSLPAHFCRLCITKMLRASSATVHLSYNPIASYAECILRSLTIAP